MKISHSCKTPKKTNSFFFGVFFLTIANIIVKIIGLFFKIPISHILGDEGMGYFNSAYTIYTWFYMLSTAGFPIAISILVSKALAYGDNAQAHIIKKISISILCVIGALLTAIMMIFSKKIAAIIGSPRAFHSIMCIAPSLIFVCIAAALRGYYQGNGIMQSTALSQVIEAFGKCIFGILLGLFALRRNLSLSTVAAFSILGVTLGSLFSMVYLLIINPVVSTDRKRNQTSQASHLNLIKEIFKISFPITLGATVMGLTNVIDLGMIMRRLQSIGYTTSESTALYGNYTTLVVPMFNLPTVFVYSIAYAIVPAISGELAKNDFRKADEYSSSALGYTTLVGIPCAMGIGSFSYSILSTIFPQASAVLAAPYLTVLSPGIVFICILSITNSILQAYGYPRLPIISVIIGGIVKIVTSYLLIGNPNLGMMGAPISTILCYLVASTINLIFIYKKTDVCINFKRLMIKPLWASCIAVGGAFCFDYATGHILPGLIKLIISVIIAVIMYVIITMRIKLVSVEDILVKFRKKGTSSPVKMIKEYTQK